MIIPERIHYPPLVIPLRYRENGDYGSSSYRNYNMYLTDLAYAGVEKRYGTPLPEEVRTRLDTELFTIHRSGSTQYFLFVADVVKASKKRGAIVGCGRGAAAGSLVNYALGITDIDPLRYGLLFERFFNLDRLTILEIDLDFDEKGRETAIEYLIKRYGKHRVGLVSLYKEYHMIGTHIHTIVVAPKALKSLAYRLKFAETQTPLRLNDKSYLDDLGLLNIDLIAWKALNEIRDILDTIKQKQGIELDLSTIPDNDAATFERFSLGETDGLPFFNSKADKAYLKKLQPASIEDLSAVFSLNRPGAIRNMSQFIARKNGAKSVKYLLPEMENILGNTCGIIVYQEQIMLLAQKLANFTNAESDHLRKVICKRLSGQLEISQEKFIEGCIASGFPSKVCEKVWEKMKNEGLFTVNKSHTICYSMVCYHVMWLRVHHSKF